MTWIRQENLIPVLSLLAELAHYRFDPDDIAAVEHGIENTDDEANRWFEYPLHGEQSLEVQLALDSESPIVLHIRVQAPENIRREVEWTLSIASIYAMKAV